MIEIVAKLNKLNIAPRKVRAVIRIISGLPVGEAEAQLLFRKERAALPIIKLLKSAVANAQNQGMAVNNLYVKRIWANEGQVMKRWLPRARGMATPLHKKFSHITIVLAEDPAKKSRFTISKSSSAKESLTHKRGKTHKQAKAKKSVLTNKEINPLTKIEKTKKDIKADNIGPAKADNAIKRMFRRKSV